MVEENEEKKVTRAYLRVSTQEQTKGLSIKAQKNRLDSFCKETKRYKDLDYIDGGFSAYFKDIDIKIDEDKLIASFNLKKRPAFKQMLLDAQKEEFNELIFTNWDRISRSSAFSKLIRVLLENKGIKLTPTDDSEDNLVVGITSNINEEISKKISEKVNFVMKDKFEQGFFVGKCPFGYKLKKKKIIVDEKKAYIVKQIFQLTLEGKNYKEICKKLTISFQSYYPVLHNPIYAGITEARTSSR